METRLGPFEENTIVVGDCLDIMAQMPDGCVDLVVTDPPYNVGRKYHGGYDDNLPLNEWLGWCQKWLDECLRLCRGHVLVSVAVGKLAPWLAKIRPSPDWILCHFSGNSCAFTLVGPNMWEPYMLWKGDYPLPQTGDGLRYPIRLQDDAGFHDCPKQEPVWRRLVRDYSCEGDLVADFFIGSGTTAVVADRLGRKFFGCDINPDYVEMALERLEKDRAGRQLGLL